MYSYMPEKTRMVHQKNKKPGSPQNIAQLMSANDIINQIVGTMPIEYNDFTEETIAETQDITFGIELEVMHPRHSEDGQNIRAFGSKNINDSIKAARERDQSSNPGKLTTAEHLLTPHEDEFKDKEWNPYGDASLNAPDHFGIEWVSPILRTETNSWKDIKSICDIIHQYGGVITDTCSEHIHIGDAKLNSGSDTERIDKYSNLYKLYGYFQDIIDVIARSNYQIDGKKALRTGSSNFAKRLTFKSSYNTAFNAPYHRKNLYEHIFEEPGDERNSLNIKTSTYEGIGPSQKIEKGTVEIRRFNGTFDPKVIQANALLSTSLMQAAATKTTAAINSLLTTCNGKDIKKQLELFVDFITSSDSIKKTLIYAYYANSNDVPSASPSGACSSSD